jgi:hypothetical protein
LSQVATVWLSSHTVPIWAHAVAAHAHWAVPVMLEQAWCVPQLAVV